MVMIGKNCKKECEKYLGRNFENEVKLYGR
jgi:hypothetical protein